MIRLPSRLLAVTDRHQARAPLPKLVAHLIAAGVRWIWLRDRDLAEAERLALAEALRALTRASAAALTIGADVGLAEHVGADGVQLRGSSEVAPARRRLGDRVLLGVSTHSPADCRAAKDAGADYATLSPIFPSPSKPGYGPALGLKALTEAAGIGLPVLALGGVTATNAPSCLDAGATGVAIMGALMRQEDNNLGSLTEFIRRS